MTAGPAARRYERGDGTLFLIAALKVCKAVALLVVAVWLLRAAVREEREPSPPWSEQVRPDPRHRILRTLAERVHRLPPATLEELSAGTVLYAGLYATEGYGLFRRRRWAEWLTVVTTAGLIPVELYESVHRPGWLRVGALVVNVLAAAYLVYRLRRDQAAK
ncbi:MAG TPA: DUF2127 domain-containing protein [Humisphaera sp.]